MRIQSLSVVVPTKAGVCINNCPFCVSKLGHHEVKDQICGNQRFRRLYEEDFVRRLMFARDNGCNTVILTGDGEPLQNKEFIDRFTHLNNHLSAPFRNIELQTTGVFLDDEHLRWLRDYVGVSTISLSISHLFSSGLNNDIIGVPNKVRFDLVGLCKEIKRYDFNLRLSLNVWDYLADTAPDAILSVCISELGADQVTFRKLYTAGSGLPPDAWIESNTRKLFSSFWDRLTEFLDKEGEKLNILPFGAVKYGYSGASVVIDNNCMSVGVISDDFKYLILEKNAKLYSTWHDNASLIF